jgi:sporulation integral membrane protein YlbJ
MLTYNKYKLVLPIIPWLAILLLLPIFPELSLSAALRGIAIWWDVLFPALFPFFVISELLLGLGLVHFIGCLFDPMMRPLFRVPGYGGFVMAMGFASGYPIGARLTSQLWEQRLVNQVEGERLVAFTSTSDPIFLIGAVAVGFFHDPGLAVILASAHYGGGILVGLCMRYHGRNEPMTPEFRLTERKSIWIRSFYAMHEARIQDGRSLGLMLQQAIQSSLKLVFMIGGLVVFISVILEVLSITGILSVLYAITAGFLYMISVPEPLSRAIIDGLFEVTLGAKAAGETANHVPLIHKAAIASFILSWAGLSVHAQIASLLTHTNLRYIPFIIARFLHGLFAFGLVYLLWIPMEPIKNAASTVLPASGFDSPMQAFSLGLPFMLSLGAGVCVIILVLYLCYLFFSWIYGLEHKA